MYFKTSSLVQEGACSPHMMSRSSCGVNTCKRSIGKTSLKPAGKGKKCKNGPVRETLKKKINVHRRSSPRKASICLRIPSLKQKLVTSSMYSSALSSVSTCQDTYTDRQIHTYTHTHQIGLGKTLHCSISTTDMNGLQARHAHVD